MADTKLNEDQQYLVKEIKETINGHDLLDVHAALTAVYVHIIIAAAPNAEVADTLARGMAGDIVNSVRANWKDKAS